MPARKPFLLRLPPELLAELRGWAAQEMRSLNAQIEWVLREALRRQGREPQGGVEEGDSGGKVRRPGSQEG